MLQPRDLECQCGRFVVGCGHDSSSVRCSTCVQLFVAASPGTLKTAKTLLHDPEQARRERRDRRLQAQRNRSK